MIRIITILRRAFASPLKIEIKWIIKLRISGSMGVWGTYSVAAAAMAVPRSAIIAKR